MPRHAEFDRNKALEQAMKLFWTRGYSATSLPDLLATMGIARSSFYASFGDKRSLFIECLELFGDRTLAGLEPPAPGRCPTALVIEFFESTTFAAPGHRVTNGCMMVNSILELSDLDPALGRLAAKKLDAIQRAFKEAFEEAISLGSFRSSLSPQALAQYVMNVNQGLRVQCRKQIPEKELRNIVDTSLGLIGLTT